MTALLPNFLIVGAAKAGTTSLYRWLSEHPDVFMPNYKEPCYFVHDYGVSTWPRYLSLFDPAGTAKAIGEASTAYLIAPESAAWIHAQLTDPKIIILLRDPIERAWSLYRWMVMQGLENHASFEKALAAEDARVEDDAFRRANVDFFGFMYVRGGLYYEQVQRYLDLFGEDSVLVLRFENLVHDSAKAFQEVCDLLTISNEYQPTLIPRNVTRRPRSARLQYVLRRLHGNMSRLPPVLGKTLSFGARLMLILNLTKSQATAAPREVRSRLLPVFESDIMRLADVTQLDLSHWLDARI